MKTDWLNPDSWDNGVVRKEDIESASSTEDGSSFYVKPLIDIMHEFNRSKSAWNSFDVLPTEDKVYKVLDMGGPVDY